MTYPNPGDERYWTPDHTHFGPNTPDVGMGEVFPPDTDPVWRHMRKDVFMHIGRYLRNLGNWMGLRDWKLALSWEPIPDDEAAYASVHVTYGQKHASIRLQQSFAMLPYDTQTHALVHELLHLHLDPLESLLRNTLPAQMTNDGFGVLIGAFHKDVESVTDALAMVIAERLPGIETDWNEKEPDSAAD